MSAEANKAIILCFFDNFSLDKLDQALELMADDATWWMCGRPDRFIYGGLYSKAEFAEQIRSFLGVMAQFSFVPTGMTAEGERVAVEAKSHGETPEGKVYKNLYNILFELREGRIQTVREYFDPLEVLAFAAE